MKKKLIEWKKPTIKSATFEEISQYVKAMAISPGTACSATSCNSGCTSCSCACAASCSPLALFWSCSDGFLKGRSIDGEK